MGADEGGRLRYGKVVGVGTLQRIGVGGLGVGELGAAALGNGLEIGGLAGGQRLQEGPVGSGNYLAEGVMGQPLGKAADLARVELLVSVDGMVGQRLLALVMGRVLSDLLRLLGTIVRLIWPHLRCLYAVWCQQSGQPPDRRKQGGNSQPANLRKKASARRVHLAKPVRRYGNPRGQEIGPVVFNLHCIILMCLLSVTLRKLSTNPVTSSNRRDDQCSEIRYICTAICLRQYRLLTGGDGIGVQRALTSLQDAEPTRPSGRSLDPGRQR